MDLKNFASFDPEEIKASLADLGTNLKHSIDHWVLEKAEALRDAAECLAVLSEGLGGLLERSEHIFVKTVEIRDGESFPCCPSLRLGPWSWDLSDHPHSYEAAPQIGPGKYRLFLIMEKVK